jgi:hypothetical protein
LSVRESVCMFASVIAQKYELPTSCECS